MSSPTEPASAPIGADSTPAVMATSTFTGRVMFVVVGAGGTGARLVPALTKVMRAGDSLAIVDHDIVEDRNLRRQHFIDRDIGRHKALVLAERYSMRDMEIRAFASKLAEENYADLGKSILQSVLGRDAIAALVILGCVDNAAARRGMKHLYEQAYNTLGITAAAWLDVGNELRGGQVLMSLSRWPLKVIARAGGVTATAARYHLEGWRAMPQLLVDEAVATESCGQVIDLQTVMANQMAATCLLNQVAMLLNGLPFSSCGTFFSTMNTMSPIKMESVGSGIIHPEMTYALTPAATSTGAKLKSAASAMKKAATGGFGDYDNLNISTYTDTLRTRA